MQRLSRDEKPSAHIPVLWREVLTVFRPEKGETYIDATVNGGGHAYALAEHVGREGKILGIDRDCDLIERLKEELRIQKIDQIIPRCGSYQDMEAEATAASVKDPQGILFDLGFSSYHIDHSGRGFSFLKDEALDMRYAPDTQDKTAATILNGWGQEKLAVLFRSEGGERYAGRIAGAIIEKRRKKEITRTRDLCRIIEQNIPRGRARQRIHPATRIFQALRIAVNDERMHLERGIDSALRMLKIGGILIVIAFEGGETRVLKRIMQPLLKSGAVTLITKSPVRPTREEIKYNPRARSAIMRAYQKNWIEL